METVQLFNLIKNAKNENFYGEMLRFMETEQLFYLIKNAKNGNQITWRRQ